MAKSQRKAAQKLQERIVVHERLIKSSKSGGREYRRPGSLNKKGKS